MYAQVEKPKDNKSKAITNTVSQKLSIEESTFQFVDNRPESVAQRGLHATANNNPQVKQAAQLQSMANNYSAVQNKVFQKKENDTGLPDNLKSGIENLSGYSMDDVPVHSISDKPAQLQDHAYAQENDINLGSGQEKHLPHEAWHGVQQKQGRVRPTMQMKVFNIIKDTALEKGADVKGIKSLQLNLNTSGTNKKSAEGQKTVQRTFAPSLGVGTVSDLRDQLEAKGYTVNKRIGLTTWFSSEYVNNDRELRDIGSIAAAIIAASPGTITAPGVGAATRGVEEAPQPPPSSDPAAAAPPELGGGRPLPPPPIMDQSSESAAAGKLYAEQGPMRDALAKFQAAEDEVVSKVASSSMGMKTPASAGTRMDRGPGSIASITTTRKAEKEPHIEHEATAAGSAAAVRSLIINYVWLGNKPLGALEKFNINSWRALGHMVNIYTLRFDGETSTAASLDLARVS